MKRPHSRPILLVCLALLAGCDAAEPPPSAPEPDQPRAAALPLAEPPLNREAILSAVSRAASDWATGNTDLQRQRTLDGKRFELKLRFGCPGDDIGSRQWTFDADEGVLRVAVEPEITAAVPLLEQLEVDGFETVEGFWLYRPWLLEAACPVTRSSEAEDDAVPAAQPTAAGAREEREPRPDAAPEEEPQARPTIGIAQFYTDQDSRTRRRDARAYEHTGKLGQGQAPSVQGYDLVLSGRLASLPDGRVIACAGQPGAQPSCVVSARFDHVALALPDGEELAQWTGG